MWRTAATGGVLLIAGAAKFAEHLNRVPTLQDYLAFRCGAANPAFEPGTLGHTLLSPGHCWGCYAMALGAGLLAVSVWQAIRRGQDDTRQAN